MTTVSFSKFRIALPQILAVSVKNILLLGFGQTLGFATIIIPALSGQGRDGTKEDSDLILNTNQISWISSINLICIPIGCLFSGAFTQPIGRRRAMQLVNVPLSIAWLMFYYSQNVTHLYASLCLAGLSGGLMEAPVLTYVAEITQPHLRGMLAATGSAFVILGVFSQFLMGTFLNWRIVALICSGLPMISLVLLIFVPESPHWLITKKRFGEAQKSLAWLRGWATVEMIEKEYQELKDLQEKRTIEKSKTRGLWNGIKLYMEKGFLRPFGIIALCFFVGHFSGMTTLQTFAVQIFNSLKAPIDKYYATIFLGICEFLGTIFSVIFIHYTGKRRMLFFSTIGCGLCFLGTATYAYFIHLVPGTTLNVINSTTSAALNVSGYDVYNMTERSKIDSTLFAQKTLSKLNVEIADDLDNSTELIAIQDTYFKMNNEQNYTMHNNQTLVDDHPTEVENHYLWLPLTLLLGSAFLSHAGIRLMPWMLIGEIFPTKVRSGASGIAGGVGYVFGFLANKLFLRMNEALTLPGTFWFYSSVSLIGTIILYFVMPETEGRTLMDIEAHYTGGEKLSASKVKKAKKNSPSKTSSRIINPQQNLAFEIDDTNTAGSQKTKTNKDHGQTETTPYARNKLVDNNTLVTKL